jgi:hypothetical protein
MDNLERAKLLIGLTAPSIRESAPSVSSTNTHTVTGTATSDSKDGYVMVDMGGDSVTYGSEQSVKLATTVTVKEGDTVIINLTGADGTGKTPVVIGVVGRGDEQQQLIEKAILGVDVEYALSDSETSAPIEGWSTVAPEWISGKYMWQRTKVLDGSGSSSYSNPTCISGAKGNTGTGVSSIVEQYYLSSSNTTQTGGSWSTTCPTWVSGYYIWTRSVVTWTTGSTTYTTPVLANGINSANEIAQSVKNYFFHDDAGAHVTTTENDATTGANSLLTASEMQIRDGTTVIASYGKNNISIGNNSWSSTIKLCGGIGKLYARIGKLNTAFIISTVSGNAETMKIALCSGLNSVGSSESSICIDSDATYGALIEVYAENLEFNTPGGATPFYISMDDLKKKLKSPVVLYDNGTGTTDTVILSETAANFNHMEIFYHDTDGAYESKRIYSPNGKMMKLSTVQVGGDKDFLSVKSRWVQISGTSISTLYTPEEFDHNSSTTEGTNTDKIIQTNKILIDRVEGWN